MDVEETKRQGRRIVANDAPHFGDNAFDSMSKRISGSRRVCMRDLIYVVVAARVDR
jgi:hypothetical protein